MIGYDLESVSTSSVMVEFRMTCKRLLNNLIKVGNREVKLAIPVRDSTFMNLIEEGRGCEFYYPHLCVLTYVYRGALVIIYPFSLYGGIAKIL